MINIPHSTTMTENALIDNKYDRIYLSVPVRSLAVLFLLRALLPDTNVVQVQKASRKMPPGDTMWWEINSKWYIKMSQTLKIGYITMCLKLNKSESCIHCVIT